MFQKQESFLKPLVDQFAKEGKDKKVTFEAIFSKPNSKPKWFFRKDVSSKFVLNMFLFTIFKFSKWKKERYKPFIFLSAYKANKPI